MVLRFFCSLSTQTHIYMRLKNIIIFCEWMPHWIPLKNPTRLVSEGCPLSTVWEVIERGFRGCARARGKIWRVSPGRVPPSKTTLSEIEIQLLKKEYEKKMVNKYSVLWCFTNHAGHEKELFFQFPEDEQRRNTAYISKSQWFPRIQARLSLRYALF